MFNVRCPKCNTSSEVMNGQCSNCGYDIFEFMKNNGLIYGNRLLYDKLFICPNCGTIDAGERVIRLKCYECGAPYRSTDIDRSLYHDELINACINNSSDEYTHDLLEKYVGDTINWNIYNARENKQNTIRKKRIIQDKQKQAEEQTRQDAINIPKCPTCKSTDIKKITATSKIAGAIGFGLLSKTAKSQFECKNCGYKW